MPVTALVALVLEAGCVSAQAEIPSVRMTAHSLTFPGAPAELPQDRIESISYQALGGYGVVGSEDTYHFPAVSFSYGGTRFAMPPGASAEISATAITVEVAEGTLSLDFARKIRLTATDPESGSDEPQVLLDYTSPAASAAPLGSTLTLAMPESQPALDPYKAQRMVYELDVWAGLEQLPTTSWAVNVSIVFGGSVSFEY